MSIIYNTLERLENLENLKKDGHAQAVRSTLSNTKAEAHHPTISTGPGLGIAFKVIVSIMLCLGGTAIFMLRSNVPAQLNSNLFSQSQTLETEPSIATIPGSITSESTMPSLPAPALPAMASTDAKETDGIPVGETSEPETQPNDQSYPFDAELEVESELTPTSVVEVSSEVTGLLQAQAVELPSKASEAVRSEIVLSNNSADLAEAERRASDEQPADGHMNTEAHPALIATTTEVRPDPIGQTLEQARLALSRGQYFHGLAVLESISPVPDNRADFWLIKGSVHLGLGQLDLAEESFEFAQALVPGHAQTLVQLAVLKQEKGDHAGALTLLKDAARRHHDVPEIYLNLGYSQQALGQFNEAGRSFKIFLELTEGRTVYSEQRKMVSQWVARGPAEVRSVVDAR